MREEMVLQRSCDCGCSSFWQVVQRYQLHLRQSITQSSFLTGPLHPSHVPASAARFASSWPWGQRQTVEPGSSAGAGAAFGPVALACTMRMLEDWNGIAMVR